MPLQRIYAHSRARCRPSPMHAEPGKTDRLRDSSARRTVAEQDAAVAFRGNTDDELV